MATNSKYDRILELKLSGKFAHFRKFYTNASSLTYLIPPRTAICGLMGSIMLMPRDSYYAEFGSQNFAVAIAIPEGSSFQKIFQTLNYAQDKSAKTPINDLSAHKQCRLELLKASGNQDLCWILYLGLNTAELPLLSALEEKIKKHDFGYGLSLGQRQFIASLEHIRSYSNSEFSCVDSSAYLDSAVCKDKIQDFATEKYQLSLERMPLEQKLVNVKKKDRRQSVRLGDVLVETTGKRLSGLFTDVVELHNQERSRISFL